MEQASIFFFTADALTTQCDMKLAPLSHTGEHTVVPPELDAHLNEVSRQLRADEASLGRLCSSLLNLAPQHPCPVQTL